MVGLDNRSTLDVDATIKNLPLTEDSARKIVEEIVGVDIDDGMALWANYQRKFEYASDIGWAGVMQAVRKLCDDIK